MSSIINTFHIDWKIVIAQSINFAIVFTVLYIFALKPLNKLMTERSEKIGKGVADAKTNAELLVATKAEYEKALATARAEAQIIFQEGKKQSEQKRAEMMETAKHDVDALISNGKKTLEAEKVHMIEEARKEVVSLAVEIAKKALESKASHTLEDKGAHDMHKMS